MNVKGFIFALGKWADSHLPLAKSFNLTGALIECPRIRFPLEMMVSAGIGKILIGSAPDNVAQVRKIIQDGSRFGAEVSYLLLDEDCGIDQAVLEASEFVAQSTLLITGAGLCCIGAEFSTKLNSELKNCKGATGFRIRNGLAGEKQVKLELLALDVRAQKRIRQEIGNGMLTAREIEDLQSYCAATLRYSEVDVGQNIAYLNSVDGTSINISVLDSTDFMNVFGETEST